MASSLRLKILLSVPLAFCVAAPAGAEPRPASVSFRRDVEALLSKAGCNAGTCHGSPTGKNGFRLSLRGYDPEFDYLSLTRDMQGRRLDRNHPEESLIVLKALGRMPHGGGRRFGASSRPHALLRDWIAASAPDDSPKLPGLSRLEVSPRTRDLRGDADRQQLTIRAYFADGSVRDVTDLAVLNSSDEQVADVSEAGLVVRRAKGEATIIARYLQQFATAQISCLPDRPATWSPPPANNFVDEHVFAKLKRLGIEPSPLAGDEDFIRRAALDAIGTVLPPEEARKFLDSKDPKKPSKLIDTLLERPEYADFWALKWSDVLRASRPNMALSEVLKFQRWLRARLSENLPYDQFARALLTATDTPFENPAVLFFRAGDTPAEWSEATAQVFLGIRMQCARCHNHPFERWTQEDYHSLAAFFARLKHNPKRPEHRHAEAEGWWLGREGEQINPRTNRPVAARVPGGGAAAIADGKDRRAVLMDWLARRDNPYFARAAVNRIWYHLMGRGIVEPFDDFRESNPPSNAPLLDALAADFIAHRYDVKHTIRLILNSRTYQLSADTNRANAADSTYFSRALPRLLSAEQLLDSISAATGVPEEFEGLPRGFRAARVPDFEVNHMFLKSFGMPERLSNCACERTQESNLPAVLQLVNGESIQRQLRAANGRVDQLLKPDVPPAKMVEELFLAALNRYPNDSERGQLVPLVQKAADRKKELRSLLWALINTREFQYRH